MRPIKFRAWDKQENKMSTPFGFSDVFGDYDGGGYFPLPGMGPRSLEEGRDILMQYTGLKDKNGVEIFEGDIINRYGGGLLGDPKKVISSGPVVYWNTGFSIDSGAGFSNMFNQSELEVIGNIYSNPELLEAQKS